MTNTTFPRDPERIERILLLLGQAWHVGPDMRLGQLLMNVSDLQDSEVWAHDDQDLEENLKNYIAARNNP